MKEYLVKETLIVEIYTIGYEPEGEGIIIKILVDKQTIFCAAIDCYEIDDENKSLEILKQVSKIDLICLTHPDTDHCKGLEKVLQMSDEKTKILYPINVLDKNQRYSKSVESVLKEIAYYINMNKNNKKKPKIIACCENMNIEDSIRFKDAKTGYSYPLEINTYSPVTEVIERKSANRYLELGQGRLDNNQYSIMASIVIGNFKMLFCGDIEDNTIEIVNSKIKQNNIKFFLGGIHYLKIPHHCSNSSTKMFELLSDIHTISNSITTVYRKRNLPDKEILEKYRKISDDIYCTSDVERKNNKEKYGIVKFTVNILEKTIKTEMMYNATQINVTNL